MSVHEYARREFGPGRISTQGAYRVEDQAGFVVARYITNHAGEVVWSLVHVREHPRDRHVMTIERVLELSDRGELYAVRVERAA